jgi:hypothetical protein
MPEQAACEPKPMKWTRSETIGLANVKCVRCGGTGLTSGLHRTGDSPCHCVLREIFRACLHRYIVCDDQDAYISMVRYDHTPGADSSARWTRIAEDFKADFWLIAKRTLTEAEFWLLKLHFLWGGDWKTCCRVLKTNRGEFFHSVYRIESKLGRVYREVRPYALYPPDEYFGGTIRKAKMIAMPEARAARNEPLRPPLAA